MLKLILYIKKAINYQQREESTKRALRGNDDEQVLLKVSVAGLYGTDVHL